MAIRVQCGQCGSVMSVREEYAGTERRCPKCQGKFTVPKIEGTSSAGGGSVSTSVPGEEDFDPVAFLTGQTTGPKSPLPKGKSPSATGRSDRPTPPKTPADDFDPLEVLSGGEGGKAPPAPKGKSPPAAPRPSAPPKPAAAERGDDFDPLSVLGGGGAAPPPPKPGAVRETAGGTPPPAAGPPARPPEAEGAPPPPAATPTPPQPKRPSWAKPPPPEEQPDWLDHPPAEPERPQPKRPAWAKPPPPEEKPDWLDEPPAEPERPRPKRPAWAKPLPGEEAAPANAPGAIAPDASAAARAAAEAVAQTVAPVSADNPALQEEQPRGPIIDVRALATAIRRRARLIAVTAVTALVLFGVSWGVVAPRHVNFQVIGRNEKLTLVPVEGRVTLNGQPLAGARVIFHPEGRTFRSPEAMTDAEGRYRLRFCDGYVGAPPGRYRVQVVLIGPQGRDVLPLESEYGQFRRPSHEVPPGGGAIDIPISTASPQR